MSNHSAPKKTKIYLPGLPNLGSEDLAQYQMIHDARLDLVTQLSVMGMEVPSIVGNHAWLKNMMVHAHNSDAFIFPPMTSLPESHPLYQSEAAKRWFEFFSLVTGVHVGNEEKYGNDGVSKPCIVMNPDGQWTPAIELLEDLSRKGMFTSNVNDIAQVVSGDNALAVHTLQKTIANKKGKSQKTVHTQYPSTHAFTPFRNDLKRHHFGVAFFGSATTKETSYMDASFQLAEMIGKRGWRMVDGAGVDGCMGAADRGFHQGKLWFNAHYPDAPFKPAHVGVSTQAILRLEGPPKNLDQLIITEDIYDRMKVMIKGQKTEGWSQRLRDATKVCFVAPGGTGTLHEFATLMQLATGGSMMEGRTTVLLDFPNHLNPCEGFWDPLIATAKTLGFHKHFVVARSPEEAIAIADIAYDQWLERHDEFRLLPHPMINP
jgi:predicted Rossmann-fold nucleotide-binding protein